jgi:prevent-host-death family protein
MSATISQRELRNDSGAIMRRVEQGETFTVTRNGVPIADLLPHDPSGARRTQRFVPVAEIAHGAATLPSWGLQQFQSELAELDASVDDREADPWARGR